jgi:hypothetical protein
LNAVDLYVGDGAAVERPLLRRRGAVLIGQAAIGTQLGWCEAAGVRRAIFTHCGTRIVASDSGRLETTIRAMGRARGCDARLAHDGLTMRVPSAG